MSLLLGFDQLGDQLNDLVETNAFSPTAGFDAQGGGQMRFSGARVPDQQQVLALLKILALDQFQHQRLVHAGAGLEVERIERLMRRELGRLDASFDHPPFTVDHFQFDQTCEELNMVMSLCGALAGQLAIFPQHRWQAERFEPMVQ